jgi:mono/diheme cytochrome c family protein
VAQGGRYYTWYGCAGCHGPGAEPRPGAPDLSNGSSKGVPELYAAIAGGHGGAGYGSRIPSEQLWQIAAFVRDLADHQPAHNRRNSVDQKAEPQGAQWRGPLW